MKKHLKAVAVIVGIMMAAGLLYAAGTSYQYLKKSITLDNGAAPECWRVEEIRMKITGDHPYAIIEFNGYKDFNTFIANKPPMGQQSIIVEDINTMPCYPVIFQGFMEHVLASETFYGAEFVEVP